MMKLMKTVIHTPIRENTTGHIDHMYVPGHASASISNLNQQRKLTANKISCGIQIFFEFIYDNIPYIKEHIGITNIICHVDKEIPIILIKYNKKLKMEQNQYLFKKFKNLFFMFFPDISTKISGILINQKRQG